jgi:hypothetical protein
LQSGGAGAQPRWPGERALVKPLLGDLRSATRRSLCQSSTTRPFRRSSACRFASSSSAQARSTAAQTCPFSIRYARYCVITFPVRNIVRVTVKPEESSRQGEISRPQRGWRQYDAHMGQQCCLNAVDGKALMARLRESRAPITMTRGDRGMGHRPRWPSSLLQNTDADGVRSHAHRDR